MAFISVDEEVISCRDEVVFYRACMSGPLCLISLTLVRQPSATDDDVTSCYAVCPVQL